MFEHNATHPHTDRQCDILEFHHPSGLRHLHMTSSFPEMSFALVLKTPPQDDTGMPHILEHLTLCGSRKYPVRDPFQAVQQKTVAHDLNAGTYPLSTVYHFATTVQKDFTQLSDLYADLVFNPLLRKEDFEQEGWRLEDTKDGPALKGVVLNEMKGAYGSQGFDHSIGLRSLLAPNTPLSYSYGGHPNAITGLSFEQIQGYHAEKYHPQNAILVTTGDVPLKELHAIMDATLKRFKAKDNKLLPSPPEAFAPPSIVYDTETGMQVIEGFGVDPETTVVRWIFKGPGPQNAREDLVDQLLHHVLLDRAGNPVETLGLEYGLSTSVSYLYGDLMEITGEAGLQVSLVLPQNRKDELPAISGRVLEIMGNLRNQSITEEEWQNACAIFRHPIEASLDASASNEAISLGQSVLWGFDVNRNTENSLILKDMPLPQPSEIQAWACRFETKPLVTISVQNPEMTKDWEAREKRRLHNLLISEHPISRPRQHHEAEVEVPLPCLSRDDAGAVPLEAPFEVFEGREGLLPATHIRVPSRVAEAQVVIDIGREFSKNDLQKLLILCSIVPSLAKGDVPALSARKELEKSGVALHVASATLRFSPRETGLALTMSASGLLESVPHFADALSSRLESAPLYEENEWRKIFSSFRRMWLKGEPDRIKSMALLSVKAPFNVRDALALELLKESHAARGSLLEKYEKNPKYAHDDFVRLWNKLKKCPRHVLSMGPSGVAEELFSLRQSASPPMKDLRDFARPSPEDSSSSPKFLEANQSVNFCYRAFPGPEKGTQAAAAAKVACVLLEPSLHEAVRERGGAYGSGISASDEIITLSSFRDPYVKETYQAFDNVNAWLKQALLEKDEDKLHEAKLSVIRGLLHPQSPMELAEEKKSDIITGIDATFRSSMAQKIWNVSWQDLENVLPWFEPSSENMMDCACVPEGFVPFEDKKDPVRVLGV